MITREWRIGGFAATKDIIVVEIVSYAAHALVGKETVPTDSSARSVPMMERLFHSPIIAVKKSRNEMIENDRDDDLEELIRSAQELPTNYRYVISGRCRLRAFGTVRTALRADAGMGRPPGLI